MSELEKIRHLHRPPYRKNKVGVFRRTRRAVKILYLFPDTNVFLQCKPLPQLAWAVLGDWDQIEVLLTRPVQTEIDSLKGKGNGRLASRARKASSQIRELLQAEGERLLLKQHPLVQLCLRHDLRRDESASDQLNYEERDDQLVGTALGFQNSNNGAEVWILTNDTGPMASAKAVGLKYREIPEEWLLPPEAGELEKRENALKAEIERYKNLEPTFEVGLSPIHTESVKMSLSKFRPLSKEEFDKLLARLIARFPLCIDFGPSKASERKIDRNAVPAFLSQAKEIFEPATSEEIENYRDAYTSWEQECAEQLNNLPSELHNSLVWPKIAVRIKNVGSRPADDTLVVFDIHGSLFLQPPNHLEDEGKEQDDYRKKIKLSPAPSAPKGKWKRTDPFGMVSSFADKLRTERAWMNDDLIGPLLRNVSSHRDPNALYFKKGQRGVPSKHVEYECAQWRHSQAAEDFEFEVLCRLEPGTYSGLMAIEVHAANLTHPQVLRVPLEVSVEEVSCFGIAEGMVASLGA